MNDHCVLSYAEQPPVLQCLECGATEPVQLPMAITELVALSDAFTARHRGCRPRRRAAMITRSFSKERPECKPRPEPVPTTTTTTTEP